MNYWLLALVGVLWASCRTPHPVVSTLGKNVQLPIENHCQVLDYLVEESLIEWTDTGPKCLCQNAWLNAWEMNYLDEVLERYLARSNQTIYLLNGGQDLPDYSRYHKQFIAFFDGEGTQRVLVLGACTEASRVVTTTPYTYISGGGACYFQAELDIDRGAVLWVQYNSVI